MNNINVNDIFKGDIVSLKLVYIDEDYYFDILMGDIKIGEIDLYLDATFNNYYYGNVGYNIKKMYRGHSYAYEASKILFKIAYYYFGMKELIITCNDDNIASIKTLEKLNGTFIETKDVPIDHPLYKRGDKRKNIYKYRLEDICKK